MDSGQADRPSPVDPDGQAQAVIVWAGPGGQQATQPATQTVAQTDGND